MRLDTTQTEESNGIGSNTATLLRSGISKFGAIPASTTFISGGMDYATHPLTDSTILITIPITHSNIGG